MSSTRTRQGSLCARQMRLLCIAILTPLSLALDMSVTSAPSIPSSRTTVMAGTQSPEAMPSATTTLQHHTTTTMTAHRSSSSATSTFQPYTTPDIFSSNDTNNTHLEEAPAVFNYYFLFLAVLGVLVALLAWWVHRWNKQRKAQMQQRGQDALARDLEGGATVRRFMHGNSGRYQRAHVRRQEGLDEDGEAPPPYQPKADVAVALAPIRDVQDQNIPLAIPSSTLARGGFGRQQPPAYSATGDTHHSTRF